MEATCSAILGVSWGAHDSAAALVVDGVLAAAAEQERFSRVKHDGAFPVDAIRACLTEAEMDPREVSVVVLHEKPATVLDRHMSSRLRAGLRAVPTFMARTPRSVRSLVGRTGLVRKFFASAGVRMPPVLFCEHHMSHAASAFYASPFEHAAVLTVDGVGEWSTASISTGHGHRLRVEHELMFPDSVGLLYAAFTTYCGFPANGGEGQMMGLAPYGEPKYAERILERILDLRSDGAFRLDMRYFAFLAGNRMTNRRFNRLFDGPPRPVGHPPGQREADLAASVQYVTEEIVLRMAQSAFDASGSENLCLAGGVALNCVANSRIRDEGPFDRLWIQPAAGDAGCALGAALWAWHEHNGNPRQPSVSDSMRGAFLGPSFDKTDVEARLSHLGAEFTKYPDDAERDRSVAEMIDEGSLVGWFVGRMEFGPRALGHRSIVADPRRWASRTRLNERVKKRAGFRPFAPAVMAERAGGWFRPSVLSPYMTTTASVLGSEAPCRPANPSRPSRSGPLPAVTHVDGSARVQTVERIQNPGFWGLLNAFESVTGCPVLLNTSFNAEDEPIVQSPEDAYRTFRRCGLDALVLEHCVVLAEDSVT